MFIIYYIEVIKIIKNLTPKESGIYVFVNKVNNHKYIGQSRNIYKRINTHINSLRKNKDGCIVLQYAWNKYGEENFFVEVLELCDIDFLDTKEKYWISKYNTNIDGYNIAPGGIGYIYGESEQSIIEKEVINSFKQTGTKYIEEQTTFMQTNYHKTKEIVCINTGEIFNNAIECCNKYPSADNSIILKCCKNIFSHSNNHCSGKDNNSNSLYWCYLGDYQYFKDKNTEEIKEYFSSLKSVPSKRIICLNNLMIFNSCSEAAAFFNISIQSVCDNLKGRTHITKNGSYVFKYYNETLNNL